ncbi:hypothetical protein AN958_00222 [Leucoagaricus sp. SymC.cos]|nr:hypothetical protein AN958_00222 [Leucoagaricus sp. SymC.cos]
MIYEVKSYTAVSEFLPAVFDTLVFFCISFKIISDHTQTDANGVKWNSFFTGKSLPLVARALLRGGQQYYMIVFGMTIVSGVVLYSPSVPIPYRPMLTLAQTTLAASMACRVFRNMKNLDLTTQTSGLQGISSISFAKADSRKPIEFRQISDSVIDVSPSTDPALTLSISRP